MSRVFQSYLKIDFSPASSRMRKQTLRSFTKQTKVPTTRLHTDWPSLTKFSRGTTSVLGLLMAKVRMMASSVVDSTLHRSADPLRGTSKSGRGSKKGFRKQVFLAIRKLWSLDTVKEFNFIKDGIEIPQILTSPSSKFSAIRCTKKSCL